LTGDINGNINFSIPYKVSKRTTSAPVFYSPDSADTGKWFFSRNGSSGHGTVTISTYSENSFSGYVGGTGIAWCIAMVSGHWTVDSEL
jgi:hypothetical protein